MKNVKLTYNEFEQGSVWLVGAGPGDPSLLTLQAVNAIQNADIIVYDALVTPEILEFAGDAELEYAGKRGGKPSFDQRDISLRLVELAKMNKKVCRLKGGDPFVFARGAEEALILREHNIPFRVVAGITAGIGGLANSYIPLTHRDINHHVTFMTGHDAKGKIPDVDWHNMAKAGGVLVLYMAVRNIKEIAQKLINGGRNESEPIAFISNATTPKEKIYIANLKDVAENGAPAVEVPAVIVIGEVVRLREQLMDKKND